MQVDRDAFRLSLKHWWLAWRHLNYGEDPFAPGGAYEMYVRLGEAGVLAKSPDPVEG